MTQAERRVRAAVGATDDEIVYYGPALGSLDCEYGYKRGWYIADVGYLDHLPRHREGAWCANTHWLGPSVAVIEREAKDGTAE